MSTTVDRSLGPDAAAELVALYDTYEWWADREEDAVRRALAALRETFPDLDFLSRRTVDREPADPTAPAGPLDDLTDRQREALEAAYRAGYFEWPRTNNAEEIAPDLDITSSTLHWHLREAQRRLLSALLE